MSRVWGGRDEETAVEGGRGEEEMSEGEDKDAVLC